MATKTAKKEVYIEGIGRRKEATARVRIVESGAKHSVLVNDKKVDQYFNIAELRNIAVEALHKQEPETFFSVTAKVQGGGEVAQAEAVRHGMARALVLFNAENRKTLKKEGFLKRDPRTKERKKPGLKKARKRPAWSKR